MKKYISRFPFDERGVGLTELAIIIPTLLTLVFGLIALGSVLQESQSFVDAAQEGAREGVRHSYDNCVAEGIRQAAKARAQQVLRDTGLDEFASDDGVNVSFLRKSFAGVGGGGSVSVISVEIDRSKASPILGGVEEIVGVRDSVVRVAFALAPSCRVDTDVVEEEQGADEDQGGEEEDIPLGGENGGFGQFG